MILLDDFLDRRHYHQIIEVAGPPEMIGSMARFEVPQAEERNSLTKSRLANLRLVLDGVFDPR